MMADGQTTAETHLLTMQIKAHNLEEAVRLVGQVAENLSHVFWLTNPAQGRMEYVSSAYEAIWGRTCESLLESPASWQNAIDPEDRKRLGDLAPLRPLAGACDQCYRIIRPDGTVRWIHERAFPLRDAAGEVYSVLGVAVDVTELNRAQEKLALREEQYRQVFTSVSEGLIIRNWDGSAVVDVNPAFSSMLGYSRAEALGLKIEDYIAPDSMRAFRQYLDVVRRGDPARFEGQMVRKDGNLIHVDARGSVIYYNGHPHLLGAVRDVSESKRLEEQFLRAQRIETIGMLAGGIAHDLNNILAPMLMAAGLLKGKLTEPREQGILTIIEQGAQRGASIVRQLLTFSRGIEGEKGSVQVRHLIHEIVPIMQETFPSNIRIEPSASANLWPVTANATQLHQVLMNLSVNARDAMPDGGRLSINAANAQLTEADCEGNPLAKPGHYVVVTVADTGHGIPKELMDRIFEPFFTTKEVGQGTGLGLSTVLWIIKNHGGFVTVKSEPAKGTEFKVCLPAAESPQMEVGETVAAAPQGAGELILVADDEAPIRLAAKQVLEANGYRVVTAANGAEALRMFVQLRDIVRVVLADMVMPVMSGPDLVRSLRILEPRVKVVVMSGTDKDLRLEDLGSLGVREFLSKPSGDIQLLQAIHRVLAAA
jgi:PAS domain S-box-containing protein